MTETYEVAPKMIGSATVRPPGSKSITNRALVAAALAPGLSTITAPLHSGDTEAMVDCLRTMGVRINSSEDAFVVRSTGRVVGGGQVDVRASGTTARFLTAVATLADGPGVIDGTARMRQRPMGPLIAALNALGADVKSTDGFPPVRVGGGGLQGGETRIESSESSQFASAVMLVAPNARLPVVLELGGDVVSRPYLDTTTEVMAAFGADVTWLSEASIRIESSGYRPAQFLVEADASAAIYPWAAAAVTGSTVTVVGIDPSSTQADMLALDVLEKMGCEVDSTAEGISVTGPARLTGVSVDMGDSPDASLTVAVVAAFARSATKIRNVASLRIKETDRIRALETELTKLGADVTSGPDWIRIEPRDTRPARIATYDDHRMAMSFSIAGLRQGGVVIEDPQCVAKTWPGFFNMLESL